MRLPPFRAVMGWILAALLVSTLAYTVWPTPWRFEHPCDRLVRINRFTGAVDVLLDAGWQRLTPNPFDDAARMGESERLGYWVTSAWVCPSYRPPP